MSNFERYVCKCIYCLHPFGAGAPVCVREQIINKDINRPIYQCTEKGCNYYKAITQTEIMP